MYALDVLERAGGMGASTPCFIKNSGLGKSHGSGAVHQVTFSRELATGGLHEAGFHLDGNYTHIRLHTARSGGHGDVQQGHAGPTVGDGK